MPGTHPCGSEALTALITCRSPTHGGNKSGGYKNKSVKTGENLLRENPCRGSTFDFAPVRWALEMALHRGLCARHLQQIQGAINIIMKVHTAARLARIHAVRVPQPRSSGASLRPGEFQLYETRICFRVGPRPQMKVTCSFAWGVAICSGTIQRPPD